MGVGWGDFNLRLIGDAQAFRAEWLLLLARANLSLTSTVTSGVTHSVTAVLVPSTCFVTNQSHHDVALAPAVLGLTPHLHGMCSYNASSVPGTGSTLFSSIAGPGYGACGSVRHGTGAALGIPRVLFVAAAATLVISTALSLWVMYVVVPVYNKRVV